MRTIIVFGLKNTLSKLRIYALLLIGTINAGIYAQNQLFLAYIKQIGVFKHLKENPAFENFNTFRIVGDVGGGIGDESFYQLNDLYKNIVARVINLLVSYPKLTKTAEDLAT